MRAMHGIAALALVAACRPDAAASNGPPAVRYDAHVSAGGLMPPAATLANPFAGDARSVEQGAGLFVAMNCDGCHGGGGTGFVGPSLVDGRWRYGGADGALFQSVFYGRPRGMPAYGGILPPDVVWKIVTYLQAQPVRADVATQAW